MDTFAGCKIDKAGTYTLTAAAIGLTSAVSATPNSATISSTQDSHIQQASKNANFGTDPDMFVKPNNPASMRGAVKFALPTLGAGCTVTAATLRLKNHGGLGRSIDVYLASTSWAEASVTRNNVTHTGTAANSTAVTGWQEWAVTAHVISQYTTNNGFVMRNNQENGGSGPTYYTHEGTYAPQLIVTWG